MIIHLLDIICKYANCKKFATLGLCEFSNWNNYFKNRYIENQLEINCCVNDNTFVSDDSEYLDYWFHNTKRIYLIKNNFLTYVFWRACKKNWLSLVKFLHININNYDKQQGILCAMEENNFIVVKYLISINTKLPSGTIDIAIDNCNFDAVVYFYNNFPVEYRKEICNNTTGPLHLVKFLHETGAKYCNHSLYWAVYHGNIDVVNYLYSIGLGYKNTNTTECAIRTGNLDMIIYLYSINELFSLRSIELACEKNKSSEENHIQIIKYLNSIKIKCINRKPAIKIAMENGFSKVVKYLRSKEFITANKQL